MKKLLLFFCSTIVLSLSSQTNWQWALAPDSGLISLNGVEEMALDKNDNVFITGNYNSTIAIAGFTLPPSTTPQAARCGYTAKINKNGAVQWIQTASSSFQTNISTDDYGNSYVAGKFWGNLAASGSTIVSNSPTGAVYLLKYSPAGNLLWGKTIGTGSINPQSMKQVGNKLYLCGYAPSSTVSTNYSLGSYTFATLPSTSVFYMQLDTSGAVLSADRFAGFLNYQPCIAVSPNGNITLSAWASTAPLVIGSQTLAAAVTNSIYNTVVLINISAGGAVNWAKRIDMAANPYNNTICNDLNNNIYFASTFGGSVIVDNNTVASSSTGITGLLLKFDASGAFLWSKTMESAVCANITGQVYCCSVTADKSGNVSVSGRVSGPTMSIGTYTLNNPSLSAGCFNGNLFIAQFESSGNTRGALIGLGLDARPEPFHIKVDNNYNVVVAGRFNGTEMYLGPNTLHGDLVSSVSHLFVAKSAGIINGISSNSPSSLFTVYPIPSTSEVVFSSADNHIRSITLYDLTGKLVATKTCNATKVELSIAELAPGIYTARIETQDRLIKTMKVVKAE